MENPNALYDYNLFRVFFDEVDDRPCMVLGSKSKMRKNAYVIPLDSAYKYSNDEYLMNAAKEVCKLMTLGSHKNTVFKVADIILNHLEELVRMVPNVGERKTPEEDGIQILVNGDA